MTDTTTAVATTKPGFKTTEFWLSAAATLLSMLFASGLLHDGSTALKVAGLAAAALTAAGYSVARGMAKSGS